MPSALVIQWIGTAIAERDVAAFSCALPTIGVQHLSRRDGPTTGALHIALVGSR
jgi:hypothetical protein